MDGVYDERDLYTGLATFHWGACDERGWDHDGGALAFNIFFPGYGDLSRVHEDSFPRPWQDWAQW